MTPLPAKRPSFSLRSRHGPDPVGFLLLHLRPLAQPLDGGAHDLRWKIRGSRDQLYDPILSRLQPALSEEATQALLLRAEGKQFARSAVALRILWPHEQGVVGGRIEVTFAEQELQPVVLSISAPGSRR